MIENKLNQKMHWRNKTFKIKNMKETRKSKQVAQIEMFVFVGDKCSGDFSMFFHDLQVTEQKFVEVDSVDDGRFCR